MPELLLYMINMIRTFLLLSILIFFFNVSAQSKKEIRKYNIKSSTVTVDEVDNSGERKTRTDKIIEWDKNGNIIKDFEYNKDGKLKKGVKAKFDKNDKIIEEIFYDQDENIKETITYSYNRLNQRILSTIYNDKMEVSEIVKYEYNGFGELVSEISSDKNGILISQSIYKYDNKGLRTERTIINNKGEVVSIRTYNYKF